MRGKLVAVLVGALLVLSIIWCVAGTSGVNRNLTLAECEVSLVDSKVVSSITGLQENGDVGKWHTEEGNQPGELLIVCLKVRRPASDDRMFEVDNSDLTIGWHCSGDKYGERHIAGALDYVDDRPDLGDLPLMMLPLEPGAHLGIHREGQSSPFYLLAGFIVAHDAERVQLYIMKPQETIEVRHNASHTSQPLRQEGRSETST